MEVEADSDENVVARVDIAALNKFIDLLQRRYEAQHALDLSQVDRCIPQDFAVEQSQCLS